jgi:tripartite ATP-independent transporter DctM subunit
VTPELVGIASLAAVVVLVLLRLPVAIALGTVGVVGYAAIDGWERALNRLGNTPFDIASGYGLSVLPLFLLMGAVAARSGLAADLFRAANALFAGLRGALAMAAVGTCAGFGAICGSSLATAATMTRIAVPEMRRFSYDLRLATGAVASGGTLGILIPPSIILVIYAIIAQESVAALFAAALVPGIILALLHVIVVWAVCRLRPGYAPVSPPLDRRMRLREVTGVWQVVLLFGVSVGGIYAGVFSPTEAAAVGALGAILLGLATRRIGRQGLAESLVETARTTAALLFIVVAAFIYAYFLVQTRLPAGLTDWVAGLALGPTATMLILIGFYLVLGCFIDALGMILITVPVFLPLVIAIGYDPVWFGVLLVIVVEVGLITPPVGMNLFVIRAQQPDIPVTTLYQGILPFLAAHAVLILLLLAAPPIALWLPGLL